MNKSQREGFEALARTIDDYFGDQAAADAWLRQFAGLTLKVPPPSWIEQRINDRRIHRAILRENTAGVIKRLADAQHVPIRAISKRFHELNGGVGVKQLRKEAAEAAVEDGQPRDGDDSTHASAPALLPDPDVSKQ